jgi:hypothetical protein
VCYSDVTCLSFFVRHQRIEAGSYVFIGECYADGIMYGEDLEGMADQRDEVVEFRIV